MKVLFLDVDGVLNSADWFAAMQATKSLREVPAVLELDPKAIKRVLNVLEKTGAKIVLSSTWRLQPKCMEALVAAGLPIFDVTPSIQSPIAETIPRSREIALWLYREPDVTHFAIIDDDSDAADLLAFKSHFVKCHWKHGMYGKHEKKLIEILGEA